jgi:serine protease
VYVLDAFNVTIDDGSGSGPDNYPPTADFTYAATDLTVDFTDQSTDSDGSVVSWAWDFGDGATSTTQNPSHTYASSGTYPVTLTVTDDDGATGSVTQDVTVTSGGSQDVQVTGIDPDQMDAGTTIEMTISGSGFQTGASVLFENGRGPAPTASNVLVVDGNTITASVSAKSSGPRGTFVWDVRVTNPDNSTGVLAGGFTVIR